MREQKRAAVNSYVDNMIFLSSAAEKYDDNKFGKEIYKTLLCVLQRRQPWDQDYLDYVRRLKMEDKKEEVV